MVNKPLEILDCLPDGVLVHREGRILHANRAMAAKLGAGSARELVDTELKQWLHPDERRTLAELLAGVDPLGPREVRFLTKSGETLFLEVTPTSALPCMAVEAMLLVTHDLQARKQLEAEVLRISNRERQRIAHDLHDGLGQHLAGMALKARALHQSLVEKAPAEAADAEALVQLLNDATAQTRSLAQGLDPAIDRHGFPLLMEKLALSSARLFRIACRFVNTASIPVESAAFAQNLYLIAQEAVNNAVRHGQATDIEIALSSAGDTIMLEVRDNGGGLKTPRQSRSGMGLRIMQHRAAAIGGTLAITSIREGGTSVLCRVPGA